MIALSCPSCGAEVKFQSAASVFAVCEFCKSMLVRRDLDLDNLGKMAQLQEDMSPLQIGSVGKFEKTSFSIIGRLKVRWEFGTWNEWYLFFHDGKSGWLAEAQGFYMVSFLQPAAIHEIPKRDQIEIGNQIDLKGNSYQVDDVREAWCEGSAGELPFQAIPGHKMLSVDLTGPQNQFACLTYSPEGVEFYLGKYVDFENLHFQNLRPLDGW